MGSEKGHPNRTLLAREVKRKLAGPKGMSQQYSPGAGQLYLVFSAGALTTVGATCLDRTGAPGFPRRVRPPSLR